MVEKKRSKREYLEPHVRCSRTVFAFPQDIIEKHSLVDVAPIPGVKHVKTCVLCDEYMCLCLFTITYCLHMSFVTVKE